jgi:hypothetical protein
MNEPPFMPPILPQNKGPVTWGGSTVSVRARVVPRFLWTTCSIDVYLDEQCILQTGGALKPTGSCYATFNHGGATHSAELSWGVSAAYSFPYRLNIDGVSVMSSRVRADNWYLTLIVGIIFGTLAGVLVFHLFHRGSQGILQ